MTPEQAFFSKIGCHPVTGMRARDWYACGSDFVSQPLVDGDKVFLGNRMLQMVDVASGYRMGFDLLKEDPGVLQIRQLIPFLDSMIERFGKPSHGVVISHSCWLSSLELELDDDTTERGEFLRMIGAEFGPMPDADKDKLVEWGKNLNIKVLFDADQMPSVN